MNADGLFSLDDPRLTAFALGELEGEELRTIAAWVQSDPAAQAVVARTRRLAEELQVALVDEPLPEAEPAEEIAFPGVRRADWAAWSWRVWLGAGLAAAVAVVILRQEHVGVRPAASTEVVRLTPFAVDWVRDRPAMTAAAEADTGVPAARERAGSAAPARPPAAIAPADPGPGGANPAIPLALGPPSPDALKAKSVPLVATFEPALGQFAQSTIAGTRLPNAIIDRLPQLEVATGPSRSADDLAVTVAKDALRRPAALTVSTFGPISRLPAPGEVLDRQFMRDPHFAGDPQILVSTPFNLDQGIFGEWAPRQVPLLPGPAAKTYWGTIWELAGSKLGEEFRWPAPGVIPGNAPIPSAAEVRRALFDRDPSAAALQPPAQAGAGAPAK